MNFKIKHFFIAAKIFIDIFHFIFMHKLSVSVNNSLELLPYLFLSVIIMDYSDINTLLKSNTHTPKFARLLTINAFLRLLIAPKYCHIFFATYSLVLMSILNSLSHRLQVLHQFSLSNFPLSFHCITLLINF